MTQANHHGLTERGLHALAPWAWRLLVLAVLLLASYVAAGRLLMSQVPALRAPILAALNERLPFVVEARQVEGGWGAFSPELRFEGLRLVPSQAEGPPVILAGGGLRLDVPASLASRSLQLSRLELAGVSLDARLLEDGSIALTGFRAGGGALRDWLETFLPNVQLVSLRDSRLRLATAGGELDLALDLVLRREGNARRLQGKLHGDSVALSVHAEGVGNPLKPLSWAGDIFVDASSPELAGLGGLWESLDWPFILSGDVSAQFWLSRTGGDSSASLRVGGRGLRLEERGGAWSLPLDVLSFEGVLEQRERHWSMLTEDFHVERADRVVDLSRVQFDWWGNALRIRATDLGLGALPSILAAAPGLPAPLREALPELSPRGRLDAVELRLDDLTRPGRSWQLRASLDDIEVSSWRGSPALAGVSGYLDLGASGGTLQIDSDRLSMDFPKLYRDTLAYDDAQGELRFAWDDEALTIGSGLLEVNGEEGRARGLLAIDIPLAPRETGIELSLLIGLRDSKAQYRGKYLPFRLPPPLLTWLQGAIPAGDIASAGFLWRGSIRRGQNPHRTFSLFVDTRDATLAYDPAWPPLTELAATVWVDDGRTFGRARSARSAGADLDDLMVRALPRPGGVRLDVATHVGGDASAAESLLEDSPLAEVTRGVFADWRFGGAVEGDLAISLELGEEPMPPWIDLDLALDGVEAHVAQVNLPLSAIEGRLRYRSEAGFAGSRASLDALGGRIEAEARPAGRRGLDLGLTGAIEARAIADWLKLPLLRFAEGRAPVSGSLRIDDSGAAGLTVESPLTGVALDVPRPFSKAAAQPLPLKLTVPLQSSPRLDLALGERVRAALQFGPGGLAKTAAAVGGEEPRPADCDARYCLAGELSVLDAAAWGRFYSDYLAGNDGSGPAEDVSYRIESLTVGEVSVGERSFGGARFDLWGSGALWQGALESPWLQGSVTRRNGELELLIEDIDLARTTGGEPLALDRFLDFLPTLRVDVLELRSGERRLGELGFDLVPSTDERALYATGVEGSLWGLDLADPYPGFLSWRSTAQGESTALEFDTTFDNLGTVLENAGFPHGLDSEQGSAALRLRWNGPPTAFDVAAAEGSLLVEARRGRVLESRPGPLALIGFLNFAEIVRGLSLSHMFEAGIPFEEAAAELYLHRGTIEVADLHIDGATSAFAFTGVSDVKERRIDGELVVTLPVANNLPWVAALAGGPAMAAGVFVVSKVFEKQVKSLSSAVYGVTGNIQAPDVEFRRLFDAQVTPTPATPADSETGGG